MLIVDVVVKYVAAKTGFALPLKTASSYTKVPNQYCLQSAVVCMMSV